jgi:nucleoside-diphosphate-sugar epimerase
LVENILVTGASGFLGGRITERFSLCRKNVKVRALVRTPAHAVRIARLPIELVFGDLKDLSFVRKAVKGCDIIIHCAIGSYKDTIQGTKNIMKVALEYNVKKFIHISSVAVYGYSPKENIINEDCNFTSIPDDEYVRSKIDSERIAIYYYKYYDLPLIILRPTNIFGPYSRPWTINLINMLKSGSYVLIDGGDSPSNFIYVDNVVDAVELAMLNDDAIGEAFIISDNRIITWKEVFSAYARMFPHPPKLLDISSKDIEKERRREYIEILKETLTNPRKLPFVFLHLLRNNNYVKKILASDVLTMHPSLRNFLIKIGEKMPDSIKESLKNAVELYYPKMPDQNLIKIFTSKAIFSSKKAEKILGFKIRWPFEEGMKLTEMWLKYQRLIP